MSNCGANLVIRNSAGNSILKNYDLCGGIGPTFGPTNNLTVFGAITNQNAWANFSL